MSLKRDLIKKHIEDWNGLGKLSIDSFAKHGKVSGSFLMALESMMEEYHQSKVNNGVLDDVIKCDGCNEELTGVYAPQGENKYCRECA